MTSVAPEVGTELVGGATTRRRDRRRPHARRLSAANQTTNDKDVARSLHSQIKHLVLPYSRCSPHARRITLSIAAARATRPWAGGPNLAPAARSKHAWLTRSVAGARALHLFCMQKKAVTPFDHPCDSPPRQGRRRLLALRARLGTRRPRPIRNRPRPGFYSTQMQTLDHMAAIPPIVLNGAWRAGRGGAVQGFALGPGAGHASAAHRARRCP